MNNGPKTGVLTEQGYFGEGFGFQEATESEKEKLNNDNKEDDKRS